MTKWGNLVNQFKLAPGTAKYRVPLALWQVWLMLASGLAVLCVSGFTWWRVAALLAGFAAAWVSHELWFAWFAEDVVGLVEPDQYPYDKPYTKNCYTPSIERWHGPQGSDPGNKLVG